MSWQFTGEIEVFRRLLGDEEMAQRANEAFEGHYAVGLPSHIGN